MGDLRECIDALNAAVKRLDRIIEKNNTAHHAIRKQPAVVEEGGSK